MEIEESIVTDKSVDVTEKEKELDSNGQEVSNDAPSLSEDVSKDLQMKDDNATPDSSFKKPCFETFRKPQRKATSDIKADAEVQENIDDKSKIKPTNIDNQNENISTETSEETNKTKKVIGKPFVTPAEQLKDKSVPIPYKEPKWSGLPEQEYSLEVMKNGVIVDQIKLEVPFKVVGRSAGVHMPMEHPSISRFHCVIQYRLEGSDDQPRGFYAYDLSSTHGSFLNKNRLKPHTYYHFRVGHMLKFGSSTRMFMLQGPDEDQEPESELSVTELMALAKQRREKMDTLDSGENEKGDRDKTSMKKESKDVKEPKEESDGINWGMAEDAVEEEEDEEEEEYDGENPFAAINEELYLDDPKKTLRGWYEREGYDLPNYEISDISNGHYRCKVNIPVEGTGGGPMIAQVEHKGKKKDAVVQCALEACRMLDRKGVLRQAKHESRVKKKKDWAENDYYDSDEDEFLDRTGDIEKKRIKRMKANSVIGQEEPDTETYQSLMTKYNKAVEELYDVEINLAEAERLKAISEKTEVDDGDVDGYMKKLKTQVPDKHKRVGWKFRMVELRKEEVRLRRLINVARPLGVPELKNYNNSLETVKNVDQTKNKITKLFKGSSSFDGNKVPKVFQGVHKAFLEEEPENKVRLSRLDDNAPMPESLPYKTNETIPLKAKKIPNEDKKPIIPQEVLIAQEKISEQLSQTAEDPIEKTENKNKEKMLARLKANQCFWKSGLEKAAAKSWKKGLEKPTTNEPQKEKDDSPENKLPEMNLSLSKSSEATVQSSISSLYDNVLGDSLKRSYEEVQSKTEIDEAVTNIPVPPEVLKKNLDVSPNLEFKKARIIGPGLPALLNKKKEVKKPKLKYDSDKPEYSSWTPPVGQSGDGRTSLNDKLGY